MLQRGQQLVEAAEIDCQDVAERLQQLRGSWETLQEAAAGRLQRLREASEAQQYYLDAGEAEAWISEQELYVLSEESPEVGSAGVPGRGPRPEQELRHHHIPCGSLGRVSEEPSCTGTPPPLEKTLLQRTTAAALCAS